MVTGYEHEDPLLERGFNWVAAKLAAVIVGIFVLQLIFPQLTDIFAEVPALIPLQPWRIITHVFLHGGIEHLFYNMLALVLFGTILEKIIGWRRFLSVFFIGGLIAGIGSAFIYTLNGDAFAGSIGASGAIMGITGALAILRPRMIVYIGVPLPMIVAMLFWAALDVFGTFAKHSGINNYAHLFGLAFGILYGLMLWKNFGEPLFLKKSSADIHINEEEFEEWENKWMGKKKKRGYV